MTDDVDNIQSPCIRNCCLDHDDVCLGCFRSLAEIIAWGQSSNDKRKKILSNSGNRAKNSKHNFLSKLC